MSHSHRVHWWVPVSSVVVAGYALVAMLLPPGHALAAFGNTVQSALLLLLFLLNLLNATRSSGNARYFWGSMALGTGLWLTATLMWTWFEVVIRKPVPIPFIGDVLFFIHIVPMMGALATRPHRPDSSPRLDFGTIDLSLLLLWWVYLYTFIVIPWQYVISDVAQYGFSFNMLYFAENAVLLGALVVLCVRVRGPWRAIYAPFFVAASVYAIGSQIVNMAITRDRYYTGSVYDVPLIAAMSLFVCVSFVALRNRPRPQGTPSRQRSVLVSRLAMAAVLSLPLVAFWGIILSGAPRQIVEFRTIVTIVAMIVLPFMVFLKQHLLDREMVRLLGVSQRNYENLKRLQAQLVQSEKLSALGQFVAGAAHEINNPLTAILGYSDLLQQGAPSEAERQTWTAKIGEQARRTHDLVKNLLSFAKQHHSEKSLLDLNPIVANAVELRQLDREADGIRIIQELDPRVPRIVGDANQLLQVFFHIIGNAMDAVKQSAGGTITVRTLIERDRVLVEISDDGPGISDPQRIFDPFYTTKPVGKGTGLGLSVCYGIVAEHGGMITCENNPRAGATFTVRFPLQVEGNECAQEAGNRTTSAAASAGK